MCLHPIFIHCSLIGFIGLFLVEVFAVAIYIIGVVMVCFSNGAMVVVVIGWFPYGEYFFPIFIFYSAHHNHFSIHIAVDHALVHIVRFYCLWLILMSRSQET